MINSACRSLCSNFWVVFSSSAIRRREGSGFFSFGPLFFGESASNEPCSACRRHVIRLEEYNPSRRKRAPTRPCSLQASASRRIRRLYSAVNRRRTAFSDTSESGTTDRPARPPVRPLEEIPVALWAPSISSSPFETSTNIVSFFSMISLFPALIIYSKFKGGKCLTYIGTEGRQPSANNKRHVTSSPK